MEKDFKTRVEEIANAVKGMPYYQWQQIVHVIERRYSSEFSKEQSHHSLENSEAIINELKMFFG